MFFAVIGSNYGDEGKGMAVDYLASRSSSPLVVRHNGGAQSGHTVERGDGKFVFHELSSGSFAKADTYWAESFFPDLYKLSDEIESFESATGFRPRIFASSFSTITTIDDILINMALENERGKLRHGSCGMGINEAFLRKEAGYGLTFSDILKLSEADFVEKLLKNREEYTVKRLEELSFEGDSHCEYSELLKDDNVIRNFAKQAYQNLSFVTVIEDERSLFEEYDDVVFENGQGLRLDSENRINWPHVTASRTGLHNVLRILDKNGLRLDAVIYVTRTYLTKHGAGPLPNEFFPVAPFLVDETNRENPWQGQIRYAKFENSADILSYVNSDYALCNYPLRRELFLTHINESGNEILLRGGRMSLERFKEILHSNGFEGIYLSESKLSEEVRHDKLQM